MMAKYRFDGEFQDRSWNELPSPAEVEASVRQAIQGSRPQVFSIEIDRADVTAFADEFREYATLDWPKASVVVTWKVPDDD
jgi:hypothetical protein